MDTIIHVNINFISDQYNNVCQCRFVRILLIIQEKQVRINELMKLAKKKQNNVDEKAAHDLLQSKILTLYVHM